MWVKAEETYRKDLIYVKVQMISKVSTAVKMYLNGIIQKREAKSGHRKILHLHQHYDAGTSIKTRKEYRLGKE
jgi:hypothetical protein